MAITTIPLTVYPFFGGIPALTSVTWNSTNTKFAWVFQATKTGNIRSVTWRLTGVTTSQQVKISLQDVDVATGFPDGTIDQSATRATIAANTWYTETMDTDRAVTQGDFFAVVFEWDTTAGNAQMAVISTVDFSSNYFNAYVSGAWQKGLAATNRGFIGSFAYDDGSVVPFPNSSPSTTTNQDYNSGSTPDEYALYFQAPTSVRVVGIGWDGRSGGDLDVVLYDSDGTTVLESKSLDKDVVFGSTSNNNFAIFDTKVTLSANTFYRAAIKPTTATNVRVNLLNFNSSANLEASMFSFGLNGYLSTRTNAGSWTETNTQKPLIYLLIDGMDFGGSSSSAYSMGNFG